LRGALTQTPGRFVDHTQPRWLRMAKFFFS